MNGRANQTLPMLNRQPATTKGVSKSRGADPVKAIKTSPALNGSREQIPDSMSEKRSSAPVSKQGQLAFPLSICRVKPRLNLTCPRGKTPRSDNGLIRATVGGKLRIRFAHDLLGLSVGCSKCGQYIEIAYMTIDELRQCDRWFVEVSLDGRDAFAQVSWSGAGEDRPSLKWPEDPRWKETLLLPLSDKDIEGMRIREPSFIFSDIRLSTKEGRHRA